MQPITWVVGAGGVLGTALTASLKVRNRRMFYPAKRLACGRPDLACTQIKSLVQRFSELIDPAVGWEIYWAGGVSSMNSSIDQLTIETRYLSHLIDMIGSQSRLLKIPGCFCFSSSAGAIYSAASTRLLNEESPVCPSTNYGKQKLIQEQIVSTSKLARSGSAIFIARISTLYGIQEPGKQPKGLIAILVDHLLKRQPTHVFVPLETIRDYLWSQDAAEILIESSKRAFEQRQSVIKIVSAERPTTIAELLHTIQQISKRRHLITSGFQPEKAKAYQPCFRFQSIVYPDLSHLAKTSLQSGIFQIIATRRAAGEPLRYKHSLDAGRVRDGTA